MTPYPLAARAIRAFVTLGLISVITSAVSLHANTAYIDLAQSKSTVRGFGGASVWLGQLTDAEMDKLFKASPGCVGLTIDRVRISPNGSSGWGGELANAQKAKARGAIVMATPWTPPASMKTNGAIKAGSLNPSQYGAYAVYLNSFVDYMASNGASLYAISLQNEPDWSDTYESCLWTAPELLNFAKYNAGSISSSVKVISAESFNYKQALSDPILNDPTARGNVDIIGGHIYGAGLADYPLARSYGKELWMTEHLNTDTTITGVMQTAKEMLDGMAVASYQTYLWWYLKRAYGPLDENGNRTKRGCVIAQFARWVRPGYTRVATTYNPSSGVYTTAFKSGSTVVVIAVNTSTSTVSQKFAIAGGTAPTLLTPYRTSASQSFALQPTVAVSGGSFTSLLPGQSITTFVSR